MATRRETTIEGKTISDAWDFNGRPAVRSQTGGWSSAAMILGVELCERLATLGIAVNLVTYLTGTMHLGNAVSANAVTNFLGTSFFLCLLGGFVADTFLGRYLTIAIFTVVQAIGVTILTISTAAPGLRPPSCSNPPSNGDCVAASRTQLGVLYLALYMTALGTGGLKSSVSGFGSDQFDEADESERGRMTRFFSWFFFCISFGSLLAVTVLVYIQDNLGRAWGYGICSAAVLAGLGVFLSGTTRYRFKKLAGSPLTRIAAVVVAAWRKRGLELPSDPSLVYDVDAAGDKGRSKEKLPRTKKFRFLDHAAIIDGSPASSPPPPTKWRVSTLTDVEDVKQVIRMLPIWATTIIFWTVYAQMTTFSVSQAAVMDRHIASNFWIPAGSLTVFLVASILVTVPLYDRVFLPIARRLTSNPHGLAPLQRVFLGLVLSILAMATAAATEHNRLRAAQRGVTRSVFLLVPQFLLVGAGEVFTYVGQLNFFLKECPKGMKTMSTGLFLSTLSLGFFLSSALVSIVHMVTAKSGRGAWLAADLNKGRLYDFYWLLAALSAANLVAFLVAAKRYVYKEDRVVAEEAGGADEVEMVEEACFQA